MWLQRQRQPDQHSPPPSMGWPPPIGPSEQPTCSVRAWTQVKNGVGQRKIQGGEVRRVPPALKSGTLACLRLCSRLRPVASVVLCVLHAFQRSRPSCPRRSTRLLFWLICCAHWLFRVDVCRNMILAQLAWFAKREKQSEREKLEKH